MSDQPVWLQVKSKMTLYHLTVAWMVERFYIRGVPVRDYNLGRFLRGQRKNADDYSVIAETATAILESYEKWLQEEEESGKGNV